MINGGHDNSLLILEEDHRWGEGIFHQDSQGTSESRERLRSKNIYWVSRNAYWSWIMIIWGIISSVGEERSFYFLLYFLLFKHRLEEFLKKPMYPQLQKFELWPLVHFSLAKLCAVYNSLFPKMIWAYLQRCYILICVFSHAVCYPGINQTKINNSCR